MALQMTVDAPFGFVAADAYHRVENLRLRKTSMTVAVVSYRTKDGVRFAEREVELDYAVAGDNPFAQAYTHIKALPEFAGAVDC